MSAPQFDDATLRQIRAADPVASTWLSANAGSGKTRVLTDRVARMLLADVSPQNILCLTYTKAAASEMQNRLFGRLGEWSMLDDDDLRSTLAQLGVEAAPDADTLAKARRLFARAIETPGGLKIQTIHSFCAGILRRFPLEAGVSPGFRELDEEATASLQSQVLDSIASAQPELFAKMAALVSDPDLTGLASEIAANRDRLPKPPDPDKVYRQFGLIPGRTADDILADLDAALEPGTFGQIADLLAMESKTMVVLAADLRQILAGGMSHAAFDLLAKRCLYASGENMHQPKATAITKKARENLGPLADDFDAMAEAVACARQEFLALEAARRTLILHGFAAAFLPEYAARKDAGGWLDFDDQIQKAEQLLARPGVAEWVLYKLDGGIDHILVDEAQDTSPLQWRVIEHLSREFTAGKGSAEAGERTIFVVGDLKQSIYSFQGADPEGFTRMRDSFSERLGHLGLGLQQLELQYSFRSSERILSAVDFTFEANTKGMGDAVSHIAFKAEMPGRVDLWPLIEPGEKPERGEWYDPVDQVSDEHHTVTLARRIAAQVREMVDHGFLWEQVGGAFAPRAIHEGDVLILVQSRGVLFHEIIRALKTQELNVAGADVLKLGEELAVRDLRSALSFLAMPEDDLSLAEILRSPLFGWSEAELFDLATERGDGEYLWQALRRRKAEYPETHSALRQLRNEADFLRPYDLLERLLTEQDGRRRLVARLGEEASDGIDALLAQALAYEQAETPSLTGFLARMEGTEIKVKRRAEGRGSKVRVMTVHGAKGLESPIVFLPDTAHRKAPHEFKGDLLPGPDGTPLWSGANADLPDGVRALKQAAIEKRQEEAQRLLYVAMTRAEQWLVVAAAGKFSRAGDSWYEQVERGLRSLDAREQAFPGFDVAETGLRLQSPQWTTGSRPDAVAPVETIARSLPSWIATPAETPDRPVGPLSPSDLGGAKALPGEAGLSEEEAMLRGTRLHALLEHLPTYPIEKWDDLAPGILDGEVEPTVIPGLLAEARRILQSPDLASLFAPGTLAEVGITADLQELGGRQIFGTIDRLVVTSDAVLAVDIKTNATVPATPAQTPLGLLRQMGAYAAALKRIYPGKRVETAILWTRNATLMPLPDDLVHDAVSGASAP